jgi:hypothetical protein
MQADLGMTAAREELAITCRWLLRSHMPGGNGPIDVGQGFTLVVLAL